MTLLASFSIFPISSSSADASITFSNISVDRTNLLFGNVAIEVKFDLKTSGVTSAQIPWIFLSDYANTGICDMCATDSAKLMTGDITNGSWVSALRLPDKSPSGDYQIGVWIPSLKGVKGNLLTFPQKIVYSRADTPTPVLPSNPTITEEKPLEVTYFLNCVYCTPEINKKLVSDTIKSLRNGDSSLEILEGDKNSLTIRYYSQTQKALIDRVLAEAMVELWRLNGCYTQAYYASKNIGEIKSSISTISEIVSMAAANKNKSSKYRDFEDILVTLKDLQLGLGAWNEKLPIYLERDQKCTEYKKYINDSLTLTASVKKLISQVQTGEYKESTGFSKVKYEPAKFKSSLKIVQAVYKSVGFKVNISLWCSKGTVIKHSVGEAPKCPTGYKAI